MAIYSRENHKATTDIYSENRFIQSGRNLEVVASRILKNENLCKLLVRSGSGVLDDGIPLSEEEKAKAFTDHISTVPVVDKEIAAKNIIVLQIGDIVPMKGRGLVYSLVFDIICNIEDWNLDNYAQRPYAIMNELDAIISNTKMQSWGPAIFLGATSIKINERMLGYTMMFSFADIQ